MNALTLDVAATTPQIRRTIVDVGLKIIEGLNEDGVPPSPELCAQWRGLAAELRSQVPVSANDAQFDDPQSLASSAAWLEMTAERSKIAHLLSSLRRLERCLLRSGVVGWSRCLPVFGPYFRALFSLIRMIKKMARAVRHNQPERVFSAALALASLLEEMAALVSDALLVTQYRLHMQPAREKRRTEHEEFKKEVMQLYQEGGYKNPHQAKGPITEAIFARARAARVLASRQRAEQTVYGWLLQGTK